MSGSKWIGGTAAPAACRIPAGHRDNIHNANFREIGVGVVLGTNGTIGPQVVTQDFGTSTANPTFGTGVAYYDLNANNFYDIGEGISGLTVNVSGADVTQYCTTAIGGGWVVPVPATAATRTVTFSGLNMNQTASLVLPASKNAKADLKLDLCPAGDHQFRQRDCGYPSHADLQPGGRRERLQVEPLDHRRRRRGKLREHHQHHRPRPPAPIPCSTPT